MWKLLQDLLETIFPPSEPTREVQSSYNNSYYRRDYEEEEDDVQQYHTSHIASIKSSQTTSYRSSVVQNSSVYSRTFSEKEQNAFSKFYVQPPETNSRQKKKTEIESEVEKELKSYKHSDAINFAARTFSWGPNFNSPKPRQVFRDISTYSYERGIRAYFRVLSAEDNKYILIACHANLHGLHRGDLRFVEVNDRTITKGSENYSVIGMLFPGDVVAVTELSKKSNAPSIAPTIKNVSPHDPCIWEVNKMVVLQRKSIIRVNFAMLNNGAAIVEGHTEAMDVIEIDRKKLKTDMMYYGTAFIPEKSKVKFSEGFHRQHWEDLMALTSKLPSYSNSLGTIYTHSLCERQTNMFKIGVDAFNSSIYSLNTEASVLVAQKCVIMGSSAAQTVSNGRFDGRNFQMTNIHRKSQNFRFSIDNPSKQPTEGRWNPNQKIEINGQGESLKTSIETVVLGNNRKSLEITATIPKNNNKLLNFQTGTWIVSQSQFLETPRLDCEFLQKMSPSSNGRRIVTALYGGSPINSTGNINWNKQFEFPSKIPIGLNQYQNQYVSMILSGVPLILGNSPFGCGKSMTIVTAAVELQKKYMRSESFNKQQLLVTQSNNAGVNLIEFALKLHKCDHIRFLRYVSESNWNSLPDSSKTELDMPILMEDEFFEWATNTEIQKENGENLTREMKKAIVEQSTQKYHCKGILVGEAKRIYENILKNQREHKPSQAILKEAFFALYAPDIIVSTADSIHNLLENNVLRDVSNIQFDEASQVPEHTLISLLHKFPNASFGLVGDINQLPAYCDDDLQGLLKDYGIGKTMARASRDKMFPQSILRLVYRCHPTTTKILSDLFYNGQLISGVEKNQRDEFMRMRPDIWPNSSFPILVLNHEKDGYRMGTSVANNSEKDQVVRIVSLLTKKVKGYGLSESDIGIISFYKAQTSLLADALKKTDVKCGTIDAFQGTEREVMIVCCTNKNPSLFMQEGTRVNVAMSRARQATIIIGNIAKLKKAKHWDTIAQSAQINKCSMEVSTFGGSEQKQPQMVQIKCTAKKSNKIQKNQNEGKHISISQTVKTKEDTEQSSKPQQRRRRRNRNNIGQNSTNGRKNSATSSTIVQ
ncbi:DNA2/NAM7 helicase-like C-terminal domain-containing protein [Caenorhabditis elegans]|uniref:DNA2/NAM7 helicase-like C-terminal domain-containing protein n=1 Tax=Caenorhabditis elegans TaxID=6239 RepID=Q18633_CAEEL|nr:DNA2/NAM7 helicase-like C-terminal domain-containing protein [Caenorhabditis elegans]CAA99786.2 DNA2/NAM7 helicase-like C-terminal domain-containing protein [Caenorhabditis elegans]|eukprot:NP_506213.2 Uncharacterized protein CELE_C44H9.4 [Caenorhabditis elegans]